MIAKMAQTTTGVVLKNLNQSSVETLETIVVIAGANTINRIGTTMFSKSHFTTAFIVHQNSIPGNSGCQS